MSQNGFGFSVYVVCILLLESMLLLKIATQMSECVWVEVMVVMHQKV